jgi:hypothetical protein
MPTIPLIINKQINRKIKISNNSKQTLKMLKMMMMIKTIKKMWLMVRSLKMNNQFVAVVDQKEYNDNN